MCKRHKGIAIFRILTFRNQTFTNLKMKMPFQALVKDFVFLV